MDDHETIVIFRKFKEGGDIIALFPFKDFDNKGNCMSYQHLGQHGAASYSYCIDISVPAMPNEYQSLLNELQRIGYNLKIRKKRV